MNRLAPVAVSGLSAGVVMVAAGDVQSVCCLFVSVHARDSFGGCVFSSRVCPSLRAGGAVEWVLILKNAEGARAVCDGLERRCGVSVVCSVCEVGCVLR